MSTTQTLERVAAEVAIDLEALAGRISRELGVRVPEYERALVAAGEEPRTVCLGTLALLMRGIHHSLVPAAVAQVQAVGATRCAAGVALDTLVEVISIERELLGLAFEDAAHELGINGRAVLLAERRLDKLAAGLIAEVARGYMAAVTDRNRRQQDSMAALARVAAAINRSLELPDVAHTGLKAITAALHADAGVLWLRADEDGELAVAYTHGLRWNEDRRLRTSASTSAQILERAVRAGSAVSGPPLATDGGVLLAGVAAIGVRSRGELSGVILVGNRRTDPFGPAELTFLRSASDYLAAALVRAQQHRHEARTDSLTGLANRGELERQLAREIAGARRHARPLGLLVIDLDGLKAINDVQGHAAGDAALRSLAAALQGAVRGTDTCARIGGDEFAVVMPDTTLAQANEVRGRVARSLVESGLHVSAGVAGWDPSLSAQGLFKMADTRLYRAKRRHHRERGFGA